MRGGLLDVGGILDDNVVWWGLWGVASWVVMEGSWEA